jgi:hypothetical protein
MPPGDAERRFMIEVLITVVTPHAPGESAPATRVATM